MVASKHSLTGIAQTWFSSGLKPDSSQAIRRGTIRSLLSAMQSLNSRKSTVHNASEFGAEFLRAVCKQTPLRLLGRKPTRISIRFLGRLQPRHLAKICRDRELSFRPQRNRCGVRPPPEITRKRNFFHPAMNARFLESLKGRGLSEC